MLAWRMALVAGCRSGHHRAYHNLSTSSMVTIHTKIPVKHREHTYQARRTGNAALGRLQHWQDRGIHPIVQPILWVLCHIGADVM